MSVLRAWCALAGRVASCAGRRRQVGLATPCASDELRDLATEGSTARARGTRDPRTGWRDDERRRRSARGWPSARRTTTARTSVGATNGARYDGPRGRTRRAAREPPRRAGPDERPAHPGDSDDHRHGPARPAGGRHDPHPLDRRRPAGELRAPGRADGHGADDLRAVDPPPPPRPDEPGLAEPRPLRPERRPRVDAPVLDAPPDGLRREPRGRRVVPAVGLDHARPPGVRAHAGRRGDDRPARPGPRQRRGDGDRRAPAGGRVQPRRPRAHRPPDVRHLLGRRPPGGRGLGGELARRAT